MPNKQKNCLVCGHCCGPYFALYVEETDEERWESEGEREILERLDWERNHVTWDDDGAYNMKTGERFNRCYFLEKQPDGRSLCGIHHTKPVICRDYPPGSSEICVLYLTDKSKVE
jgi:Fe-S-cluster containining protein